MKIIYSLVIWIITYNYNLLVFCRCLQMERERLALAIVVIRSRRPCETNKDAIQRIINIIVKSRSATEEGIYITHHLL